MVVGCNSDPPRIAPHELQWRNTAIAYYDLLVNADYEF